MIVLDTHVWIWFLNDPKMVSSNANKLIEAAIDDNEILISSISTWEIALLAKKGRLQFTTDTVDWISQSEKLPFITFIPIDNSIALKSVNLPGPFHEDPADRIIVATALLTGAQLLTKDRRIRDSKLVEAVW